MATGSTEDGTTSYTQAVVRSEQGGFNIWKIQQIQLRLKEYKYKFTAYCCVN